MEFYATICRLCESPDQTGNSWIELFANNNENLLVKIRACANIAIYDNDGLPKRICGRCHHNLEQAYNFKMQCEITDTKLRHEMEFLTKNGENHEVFIPPFDYSRFLKTKEETKPDVSLVAEKVLVKTEALEEEDEQRPILEESYGDDSDEDLCTTKVETQLEIGDEVSDSEESDNENDSGADHQIEKLSEEMKLKKIDKKSGICDICGDHFDKRSNLYAHKRAVHGKQRYQCKQCSKQFSRKCRLEDHELQHTGIRQFECPQCDKKYATQSGLKTHMEDVHTDNLPYVCDKCGKGFSKEGKLRYHYAVHIETRDFICELCNKGFKTQGHLNLHKSTHLPPDKKKKRPPRNRKKTCVCPFCGKVSSSIGVHSMHIRTHTGDQRYECHICFKRFTSSGSHKKHLRVHTGEKPYVCEYCQKSFRQKHHMDTHIRGVHTNEKPYQCKFCPRAFATLGNMRLHERSHGEPADKQEHQAQPYFAVQPEIGTMIGSPASQSSSMMVSSSPSPMMNPGVVIPPDFGLFMADRTQ
ncbi:zinc finger protein 583-like [Ochlerotatus camptorhynchus]|uniref:zinc finger protein 583-like n=1 Tax=Ochlerotatus camptorhynchus TaxID=644619 RepID=UPI0031DA45A5